MTLDQLITRLTQLAADGHGNCRVIEDNGYEINNVAGPIGDADYPYDPDATAVMLHHTGPRGENR